MSSFWKLFKVLGFLFFIEPHKAEENRNYCMTKDGKFSLLSLVYATHSQQEIYKLSFCHILRPGEVLIWILRCECMYNTRISANQMTAFVKENKSGEGWALTTSRYRSQSDKLKWFILRRTTCRFYKQKMFVWFY